MSGAFGLSSNMASKLLKIFFSFQSAQSPDARVDGAEADGLVLERERGLEHFQPGGGQEVSVMV